MWYDTEKDFRKKRTGHNFRLPTEIGRAKITIGPEPLTN